MSNSDEFTQLEVPLGNLRESGGPEASSSDKDEFYEFENPNFRGSGGDGTDQEKEQEMQLQLQSIDISHISQPEESKGADPQQS